MTKNNKSGKKYIEITIAILASACLFAACSSKKELPKASYSYGPELGLASGNVDLSGDTPDINISDIKSPVGENIDFLSGVVVMNEENYDDLQIWADASTIDIFTPGNYKATYTFNFNGKSVSKEINVTIVEAETTEPELSESNIASSSTQNTNETETQSTNNKVTEDKQNTSKPNSTTTPENKTDNICISTPEVTTTSNSSSTTKPETTTKPSSGQTTKPVQTTKPAQTTKPSSSSKPNSNQTTTKKENTTREIITTKGNETTANKHIANYTIELLSGKTITVKNTTSKYIVSTRTDTSEVIRNGSKYKVSKLIIRYNTGAEQILEIVEEKIG